MYSQDHYDSYPGHRADGMSTFWISTLYSFALEHWELWMIRLPQKIHSYLHHPVASCSQEAKLSILWLLFSFPNGKPNPFVQKDWINFRVVRLVFLTINPNWCSRIIPNPIHCGAASIFRKIYQNTNTRWWNEDIVITALFLITFWLKCLWSSPYPSSA